MKIPKHKNKKNILINHFYKKNDIKFKKQNNLFIRSKFCLFILLFILYEFLNQKNTKQLKIGVIGVIHEINVGNNLVKFAISIVLKNLGYIPFIIGTRCNWCNLSFLNKTTNLIIIKNSFNEIKKDDYDILMVNSDQTWRKFDEHFLDYGFLKFAKNWNITKFIYGASLGYDYWMLSTEDESIAKELLKNFKGISIREQGSLDLIKKHFGIIPEIVLDPTLLIEKKYYLNLIKNYKKNKKINKNYIFVYKIGHIGLKEIKMYIVKASSELNINIYEYKLENNKKIEDFIYYLDNCKAVITNSFHGTIFSIIFNKPFISFNWKGSAEERLKSLGKLLGVENRIVSNNQTIDTKLLTTPLIYNKSILEKFKVKSINFIKKNLYN